MSLKLDDILTVQEIAGALKLSTLTIYKYIKERKLEAIEFGGHYRVKKSSLEKFINSHRVNKQNLKENRYE
ncbi:MAG: helix-turn-helix domain-containing protein [Candidatus Levybacteria bacterium]|nr:helix-turn-helix domain-containing protein [Candidatus Levybacteria bacterium]